MQQLFDQLLQANPQIERNTSDLSAQDPILQEPIPNTVKVATVNSEQPPDSSSNPEQPSEQPGNIESPPQDEQPQPDSSDHPEDPQPTDPIENDATDPDSADSQNDPPSNVPSDPATGDDNASDEPTDSEEPIDGETDDSDGEQPDDDVDPAVQFASQWAFAELDVSEAAALIEASGAQAQSTVVAVIDTGVDGTHPLLDGSVLPGIACTGEGEGICDGEDAGDSSEDGHGTQIAGLTAGLSKLLAPQASVRILPISVGEEEGEIRIDRVSAAVKAAVNWEGAGGQQVDVILVGLGERSPGMPFPMGDAVQEAKDAGIDVLALAGDDGYPVIVEDESVGSYYPAAINAVLTVGAYGHKGHQMSNDGADLLAPGADIITASLGGELGEYSGSSYAAAIAAAGAAVVRAYSQTPVAEALSGGTLDGRWSLKRVIETAFPDPNDKTAPVWPEEASLQASGVGYSSAVLTWPQATDESGSVRYEITQDGNKLQGSYSSGSTFAGLKPGTKYAFQVEAVDRSGNRSTPLTLDVTAKSISPIERVTATADGSSPNGDSEFASVSDNGNLIAFESEASNLIADDGNNEADVFVRNRKDGTTTRISVAYEGGDADGGSYAPLISGDGRYVLFTSAASNLTKVGDEGTQEDLFLADLESGSIEKVADQVAAGFAYNSARPYAMSADARYIAFASYDNNGTENDLNGTWDIFLKDRRTSSVMRLTDRIKDHFHPSQLDITPNGRYVTFSINQIGLLPEDINIDEDIYVYDTVLNQYELISHNPQGLSGMNDSRNPSISDDGRYVAFESYAGDISDEDQDYSNDVYVYDRRTKVLKVANMTVGGQPGGRDNAFASFSGSGRFVAFESNDSLEPSAYNRNVYIRDLKEGLTYWMGQSASGEEANANNERPAISADGGHLVFQSRADNLIPDQGETLGYTEIYYTSSPAELDRDVPKWESGAELSAAQTGASYVALQWTPAETASRQQPRYRVYRNDELVGVTNEAAYLVTGLEAGTAYSFKVVAGSSDYQWGTDPLQQAVTTLAEAETDAPANVANAAFTVQPGQVAISWTEPSDPDFMYMQVLWRKLGAPEDAVQSTRLLPKGKQAAVITNLVNRTTYQFAFAVYDAEGNKQVYSADSVTTGTGPRIARIVDSESDGDYMSSFGGIQISANGRYTVFESDSTTLAEGDLNRATDVFLYDYKQETVQLISRDEFGLPGNGDSINPDISGDGRYIVFESSATNLEGASSSGSYSQIFMLDRDADGDGIFDEEGSVTMKRISQSAMGDPGNHFSETPAISQDGTTIVFQSKASNLSDIETNQSQQLFIYDNSKPEGVLQLLASSDGQLLKGTSFEPDVSADGNTIVFGTSAAIVATDTNEAEDVYLYDADSKTFTQLTVLPDINPTYYKEVAHPTVSGDGKRVAFAYHGYEYNAFDIYVYDRSAAEPTIKRITSKTSESQSYIDSTQPSISPDGRYVAFSSDLAGVIAGDKNHYTDVFVYDLQEQTAKLASRAYNNEQGSASSYNPAISEGGTVVAFRSVAENLVTGDYEGVDVFVTEMDQPDGGGGLATLTTELLAGGKVKLTWEGPQEGAGIAGFEVIRTGSDNVPVPVALLVASQTTYTDQPPASGIYRYSIIAVDAAGAKRPYSEEREVRITDLSIQSVSYHTPLALNKYAMIGGRITAGATGTAGAMAQAVLSYRKNDELLTLAADLSEQSAGSYEGSMLLPEGATEIVSLQVTLAKDGEEVSRSALTGAIKVGAALRIELETPHEDLLEGAYLSVASTAMKIRTGVKLAGIDNLVLTGLPQAGDYRVSLVTAGGLELLSQNADKRYSLTWGAQQTLKLTPTFTASLRTKVVDESGEPIPGMTLRIWDSEGAIIATGETNWQGTDGIVEDRISGESLSVTASDKTYRYVPQSKSAVLVPGANELVLTLAERPKATVKGKITNQDGTAVPRAVVTIVQDVEDTKFTSTVKTDSNGEYTADVFAGPVKIQAAITYVGRTPAVSKELAPGKSHTVDLIFQEGKPTTVRVNLYTKNLGGQWIGPHELDWRTSAHFRINVPTHSVLSSGNPMVLKASPGDEVQVCANGSESGLPSLCGSAIVGEDYKAAVEIRLEDLGTKFKGELEAQFPPNNDAWPSMNLFKLAEEDGKRQLVQEAAIKSRQFEFTVAEAGSYVVQIKSGGHVIEREFMSRTGETVNIGSIAFPAQSFYSGKSGNAVTLTPERVALGGELQVRATFRNLGQSVTDQTKMRFVLPQGTSYVEGSGALNGQPATPAIGGSDVEFSLGQIGKEESGTVVFRLKLSDTMNTSAIVLAPQMTFVIGQKTNSEILARAAAEVQTVTLDAPQVTGRHDLKVSGIAKAGSTVRVYEGEQLLGETVATSTGTWKLPIVLPERGQDATYRLIAESDDGTTKTPSEEKRIRVSAAYPQMTQVSMRQVDGRTMTFDPSDGVAKFPYVFAPGMPFIFKVTFNNPDAVKNVVVQAGGTSAPAERGKDGVFTASLVTYNPGDISVSYEAQDIFIVPEKPSDEELREQLPSDIQDYETQEMQLDTMSDMLHTASIKGSVPVEDGKIGMDMSYKLERIENYTPPAAGSSGSPVRGLRFNYGVSGNRLSVSITAYIPESEFAALGVEGTLAKMSSAMAGDEQAMKSLTSFSGAGAAIKVAINNAMKWEGAGKVWTSIDTPYSIFDGLGVNDALKELGDIAHAAGNSCSSGLIAQVYAHEASEIAHLAMAYELAKWTMMLGSLALGPATFGWGTVGLWMLTNGIGKVMDAHIGSKIDDLKSRLANDEECKDDEEDEEDEDDDRDDNDDDNDNEDDEVAKPVWIYDPSGYVYEVTESQRVSGVKATVMYKDETTGAWTVWDADWFGQINPQITDTAGRYGWDVPRGLWKVVYEKEGYATVESAELTVPPPHFDVNIPLVSILPAAMTSAYAKAGGEYVDIMFDRHVQLETIEASGITVTAPSGEVVEGTFTGVDEMDWQGAKVARHIRFTPAAPLQAGATYTITASSAILSYNSIPSGTDAKQTVAIAAEDTTAPAAVTNPEAYAERNAIVLAWEDPTDIDFKQVEIAWKPRGSADAANTVTVAKGQQWTRLTGLEAETEYQIAFRTLDDTGNVSETILMQSTMAASTPAPDTAGPLDITALSVQTGSDKLDLSWTDPASSDLKELTVSWRKQGTEIELGSATVAKGAQQHTITGLDSDTNYEVTVTAFDQAGNSSFGVTVEAKTAIVPDTTAPLDVTELKATAGTDKLDLSWIDPTASDLKELNVSWKKKGTTAELGSANVVKGTQKHTITGLDSNTSYEITVTAYDQAGNGSTGATVEAKTLVPPDTTAPLDVTELKATAGTDKLDLSWIDPTASDLKELKVSWKKKGTTAELGSAAVVKGIQKHTITGLDSDTSYEITVIAYDQAGNGSTGATVEAKTLVPPDTTAPLDVTELKATAGTEKLELSWIDPTASDLKELKVSWKKKGTTAELGSAAVVKGIQKHTITGLDSDTSYEITVTAYDQAGNGSTGVTVEAKTTIVPDTTAPIDVTELKATVGLDKLDLSWIDPTASDLKELKVSWKKKGSTAELGSATAVKGIQKHTITGLDSDTSYEITVKAHDEAGNGSTGVMIQAKTSAVTGGGGGGGGIPFPIPGTGQEQEPDPEPVEEDNALTTGPNGGRYDLLGKQLALNIPAFAYAMEMKISSLQKPFGSVVGTTLKPVTAAFELTGGAPSKPLELTIAYDKQNAAAIDPRKLAIYRQLADGGWELVGGVNDTNAGSVTVSISRLGIYAVLAAAPTFADLADHWSRADVEVLASRGIVNGVGAGVFAPNRQVTRAEAAKLLVTLAISLGRQSTRAASGFEDVDAKAWYKEAVFQAQALGIIEGTDGKFRPNDPITREELALMLARATGADIEAMADRSAAILAPYQDRTSVSAWAQPAVAYAIESGYMRGSQNQLNPKGLATRAEAAVVLLRVMDSKGLFVK
nr:fibronectin type III domain-containing protein [Paenibacillus phyllosphaerae]